MGLLDGITLGLGGVALVAVAVVAAVARRAFHERIETLKQSLEQAPTALEERNDLPPEVLALARKLGVPKGECSRLVRLTQSGEMWLKPHSKPLAFTAQQIIAVAEVGFLWRARFRLAGVSMQIIDYLVGGEGGLQGRLLDVFPVVSMTGGEAMFRGEAMRYLGELMWNPEAILFNKALDWRVINARTLAVATGDGARRCEVRLLLNETEDMIGMEATDRPRQVGRGVTDCPWFGRGGDYEMIAGRRIPTRAEVGWIIDGAEFIYWRGRIESWSLEV
ncbi:MAG: DUF6544 family protein [Bradyrhizobium sp.]